MAYLAPIRHTVDALLLSLHRRYLERAIDGPFDPVKSIEIDRVITEQERISEGGE